MSSSYIMGSFMKPLAHRSFACMRGASGQRPIPERSIIVARQCHHALVRTSCSMCPPPGTRSYHPCALSRSREPCGGTRTPSRPAWLMLAAVRSVWQGSPPDPTERRPWVCGGQRRAAPTVPGLGPWDRHRWRPGELSSLGERSTSAPDASLIPQSLVAPSTALPLAVGMSPELPY